MFGEPSIGYIYLLMFIRSLTGSFHGNAMTASTSLMVPVEHLSRVQGFNQMLNGGLNVVAAPLGALLYEALALQWILMIDVFTALLAVVPLFFFDVPQPERPEGETLSGQATSYWQDLAAGFRYIWSWTGMFVLSMMAALLNFLLTPSFSLIPLLIKDHFGGSAIQVGYFESISGAGIIIGGLILGVWGGFKRQILTSMFGLFFMGIGVLTIGLLPGSMFFGVLIAAAIMGLSLPIVNGVIFSIMQSNVAPDMQGRVFSLLTTFAAAMSPIGLAIAGPISDYVSVQAWFVIAGIACLAISVGGVVTPAVYNIEENNPNNHKKTAGEGSPLPEMEPSAVTPE
jgi:DHA3 family macrolide efflux protein-like MFS transporter